MSVDAVVVGAGPNGLTAAITLAAAGRSVVVLEQADEVGGAARTAELTLPGFAHDIGAAVMPLGFASPAWRDLPLGEHGLEWIAPEVEFGHPLDGGRAAIAYRDVERTATGLGADADRYRRMAGRMAVDWARLEPAVLGPLLSIPRHPVALARFGMKALLPATTFLRGAEDDLYPALFAGCAAHAILPLTRPMTTSFGLLFVALAHTTGWRYPRGGAGTLSRALAGYLRSVGGEIRLSHEVRTWSDLPDHRVAIFTTGPPALAAIAGDRLPDRLMRTFTRWSYGPGAFKVDYALDGPIPWADPRLEVAGTVHVGGTLAEVTAAEQQVADGSHPEQPFVLVAQPTAGDPSRAPEGKHIAWAYCHVPNGSTVDMTGPIEAQLERFAPGFRDRVLAKATTSPAGLEATNPNLVGGDVGGGSHGGLQLILRPSLSLDPYRITDEIYLGSASTPPGGGVHGINGYRAAQSALDGPLR
ncbi:MAG: NAD(P)/FAD-dependent oxidoreductase [Acidimicrobiia bacterium]|nr:NAD(P)/FAD-dependent oxidoreductase [Acidimicrobiia bacterium]NNL71303.1 NAD(P)/FAD-dependent oxidoreductase [Acidimicrobiia bacterium]